MKNRRLREKKVDYTGMYLYFKVAEKGVLFTKTILRRVHKKDGKYYIKYKGINLLVDFLYPIDISCPNIEESIRKRVEERNAKTSSE